MSEEFGPDFISVTDEDGNEFELIRYISVCAFIFKKLFSVIRCIFCNYNKLYVSSF